MSAQQPIAATEPGMNREPPSPDGGWTVDSCSDVEASRGGSKMRSWGRQGFHGEFEISSDKGRAIPT